MIQIYGIKNCDTVKKALKWLTANSMEYSFHDFKKEGVTKAQLQAWCQHVDWQLLLNRRGTTWRKLSAEQQADLNQAKAITLMVEHTSLIKRPVWQYKDTVMLGFSEEVKASF
ncbi:MAG: ArsC family reductase [Coxiellaceae bacterium]|nr:ArsC family reductase [Coxiellaceae bacterium]